MGKIDDLIKELCPDRVKYVKLGEVSDIKRGIRVIKKDLSVSGLYPVFQNSLIPLGYYDKTNCSANTTFIIMAGAAGEIGYTDKPVWAADDCFYIDSKENLHNKYIYYFLLKRQHYLKSKVRKASIPRLSREFVEKLQIPLPPLSIQQQIVEILDTFTDSISNLQEELELREKQMEYYIHQILSLKYLNQTDSSTKEIQLGDIGKICMCKRIMKNQTNSTSGIPFYKIGTFGKIADAYISNELYSEYKRKFSFPQKGEILISASGTIGRTVIYNGEDAYFQDSNIVWIENSENHVLNKYLYYCYKIMEWNTEGGTIQRLYNSNLAKMEIPVPSLSRQQEIVDILDTFESMITNIKEEIELRQKQYEYYREKLLTFEKKGV